MRETIYIFLLILFVHSTNTEEGFLPDLDRYRTPRTLVLTFDHRRQAAEALDPNIPGHEHY